MRECTAGRFDGRGARELISLFVRPFPARFPFSPRYGALGGKPMEWVLSDGSGVARFAHEGGLYLPGNGEDWKHLHRVPFGRRLRKGDRVQPKVGVMHDGIDGPAGEGTVTHAPGAPKSWAHFWAGAESGPAEKLAKEPVFWKRDSDKRSFRSAAWQLELMPGPSTDAPPLPGRSVGCESGGGSGSGGVALLDDPDELPWQVVALMGTSSMDDYVKRWQAHDREVRSEEPTPATTTCLSR